MRRNQGLAVILFCWIAMTATSQAFAVDDFPIMQNDYTRAYQAAVDAPGYEEATAHEPRFDDPQLWPGDSKKSLYARETWKKGRVLVWADPGRSSPMGRSLDPENWLENGEPAVDPIDETCDLVLPPSDRTYWVIMRGSKNPVPWIRHVTIGRGAGLVWLHGSLGNTWVKRGGTLKYLGWFSGDKHAFVRNDNETSLQLVDHCYIHKHDDASVEFLGAFHVSDSFYPATGQTILGPGCQLAPGSRSTLKVREGATMTLLSGSYFTRSSNQIFGIDLIVVGRLQAGTKERPLAHDCRIGLSWKGRRQLLDGDANNYRRERRDDAGMLVMEQGSIEVNSIDPKQSRLVIDANNLPVFKGHVYEGGEDRARKLEAKKQGINLMLLGDIDYEGIVIDDVMKQGLVVADVDQARTKMKPVVWGNKNRGPFEELLKQWDGTASFWFTTNDRNPLAGFDEEE